MLSSEQSKILEAVDGHQHVAVFGAAGTGKSYVRDEIVRRHPCILLGPTGMSVAATETGMTVARFLEAKVDTLRDAGKLAAAFSVPARQLQSRKLVIDEVSMVSLTEFVALDRALRRVLQPSRPFGGLAVVLIGDVFQLQPPGSDSFFFETPAFRSLEDDGLAVIELRQNHRQNDSDDEDGIMFARFLSECRRGYLSSDSAHMLMGIFNQRLPSSSAIRLCATRKETEAINARRLSKLEGTPIRLGRLTLKIGAHIIFNRNVYDAKTKKLVRPNGARGIVVGLPSETVESASDSSPAVTVISDGKEYAVRALPSITLLASKGPKTWCYPLELAWALTIHKTQGQTLANAHVDGLYISEPGQAYVAVSRVRRMADLCARNLEPEAFEIERSPQWLDFVVKHSLT